MSTHKTCPYCAEEILEAAIKCRHCGSLVEAAALKNLAGPWCRPIENRMIAGVCAGMAEHVGVSITIVRLAFLLGVLFSGGMALLIYVALWITMPAERPIAD